MKFFFSIDEEYVHDRLKSQKVAPVVLIYLQIMEVWTHKSSLTLSLVFNLRGYHTLQGDNSLKSVERFDHMIFACRFQASR